MYIKQYNQYRIFKGYSLICSIYLTLEDFNLQQINFQSFIQIIWNTLYINNYI